MRFLKPCLRGSCTALPILFLGWLFSGCVGEDADAQATESPATSWEQVTTGLERQPLRPRLAGQGFESLSPEQTGIDFSNRLLEENIRNYLISGAGLTVGDYDTDGLPDLFLVCQDGPNRLFRQTALWEFEDVTEEAEIPDLNTWGCGAAFVDLDGDGDLDLFVCNKGAHNELHLNQGDGTFDGHLVPSDEEKRTATTMAAFSDYDRDGDLDVYLAAARLYALRVAVGDQAYVTRNVRGEIDAPATGYEDEFEVLGGVIHPLGRKDRLLQNQGASSEGMPMLAPANAMDTIPVDSGHGLGAVWWDANSDGWPDLYVANDLQTPDHLHLNLGGGRFRDALGEIAPFTSWYSMGCDFADINNDGHFDFLSSDMSATTHFKQKTMMGAMVATGWLLDNLEPRQAMRNMLFLNSGHGEFMEIAHRAGVASSDWTWAAIFGDLDNDGREDLFFSNGLERNVQDSDLAQKQVDASAAGASDEELHQMLLDLPRLAENNLAFRNTGELGFEPMPDWGLNQETVSHGAVFADLDRDGDLDLVVNHMNDAVGIYRNDTFSGESILVSLKGRAGNTFGLGAQITATTPEGTRHSRLLTSSRGYATGVEPVVHIGLGEASTIATLEIRWPGGGTQTFENLAAGFHYRASASADLPAPSPPVELGESSSTDLVEIDPTTWGIDFQHRENFFNDFSHQPLLPNRLSRLGPALAVGDADGDGDLDVFAGGAKDRAGALFLQHAPRRFEQAWQSPARAEEVAACWFDFEGDGDLDLYVVSGGSSMAKGDPHYGDQLFLNDGAVGLTLAPAGTLPADAVSGSCVAPADVDGDGDLDLFVGGRFVPWEYPEAPQSRLYLNEAGRFVLPEADPFAGDGSPGMVTDVRWGDFDRDGDPDLVLSTEWGPVRFYQNHDGRLLDATATSGLAAYLGWWSCLEVADLDGDGDLDLVAGNFGDNTKYQVSDAKPATLLSADFFGKGSKSIVEAIGKDAGLYPVRGFSCSSHAMPGLLERVDSYSGFARLDIEGLYNPGPEATRLTANHLLTTAFLNRGDGTFTAQPMPALSQLAPVMGIAFGDIDGDGQGELILAQGFHQAQRETGLLNSGLSVVVDVEPVEGGVELRERWPSESGLTLRKDLRGAVFRDLDGDGKGEILFPINGSWLGLFGSRTP